MLIQPQISVLLFFESQRTSFWPVKSWSKKLLFFSDGQRLVVLNGKIKMFVFLRTIANDISSISFRPIYRYADTTCEIALVVSVQAIISSILMVKIKFFVCSKIILSWNLDLSTKNPYI